MNRNLFQKVALTFFMVILTLTGGCTPSSKNEPAHYNLQFQASPQVNDAAPLKVRVLLLQSDAEFMSSDFYSLQNNAAATLGANLLNSDVFFLMPGQLSKTLSGQSMPGARYIGVMAEYQKLDGKKWRISLPLPVPGEDHFYQFWKWFAGGFEATIFLDTNGIRVTNQ